MVGKWLEMLKQVARGIARAAVIFNPKTAPGGGSFFLEPFESVARSFAVESIAARVSDETKLRAQLLRWRASQEVADGMSAAGGS
jgi:putative tryptophan/tyrosine transport system substrate-binding protein